MCFSSVWADAYHYLKNFELIQPVCLTSRGSDALVVFSLDYIEAENSLVLAVVFEIEDVENLGFFVHDDLNRNNSVCEL